MIARWRSEIMRDKWIAEREATREKRNFRPLVTKTTKTVAIAIV